MDGSALGVIVVVVLVLANGFFVASEFSMVSIRRSRLEQLEASGHPSARIALKLLERFDSFIAATQLCITMASLALGWVGEPALAHLLEPPLALVVGQLAPAAANGVAIALTFMLITSLHIVFGEQVPKLLGVQRSEATVLFIARPMRVIISVLRLPIAVLSGMAGVVLKVLGLKSTGGHDMVHSVEELVLLVSGSEEAGLVEESEARIARRAFVFGDRTAAELMTPRTELEAIPIDIGFDELLSRVVASHHSRLPVFEGSLDNIVGVLHVHDLFAVIADPPEQFGLADHLRSVLFVPSGKDAAELLDEMRAEGRQLTVVLDEYGGTAGIVTLEDIVEAVVGRIDDEPPPVGQTTGPADRQRTDQPDDQARPVAVETGQVEAAADGSLLMDGLLRLWELEELTGLKLSEEDHEAADSVGGLVMARLGRIPVVGDEVQIDGRTIRVEQLDGRRVSAVRLLG